jgi:prepilin-type N-terminal cleavage/methylation domain-containing protein
MSFHPHILKLPCRARRSVRAFTLIELLVVISIIGILAAIGLPAMRGMTRSNAMIAANRQFLDDLAYARQRAIGDHTTVFVVFVPPYVVPAVNTFKAPPIPQALYQQYTNLLTGQYTTYALFSQRQLGAQPGQATPKYLTGWRSLPNGVFIAASKFGALPAPPPPLGTPFATNVQFTFPFPAVSSFQLNLVLPYIAFNYQGQLVVLDSQRNQVPDFDEYIPLARGSIFFDPNTRAADLQENPAGNSTNTTANVIYINALTGRAKVMQQQIQ